MIHIIEPKVYKMKKRTRVQSAHWDLLIDFLEANPELIAGKFTGLQAKEEKLKAGLID